MKKEVSGYTKWALILGGGYVIAYAIVNLLGTLLPPIGDMSNPNIMMEIVLSPFRLLFGISAIAIFPPHGLIVVIVAIITSFIGFFRDKEHLHIKVNIVAIVCGLLSLLCLGHFAYTQFRDLKERRAQLAVELEEEQASNSQSVIVSEKK